MNLPTKIININDVFTRNCLVASAVFQPVEENGLSFYVYCLEGRNKTYIISDKGLQPYSTEG